MAVVRTLLVTALGLALASCQPSSADSTSHLAAQGEACGAAVHCQDGLVCDGQVCRLPSQIDGEITNSDAGADVGPPACEPACADGEICLHGDCQDLGIVWVAIPAGSFELGCSPGDESCGAAEFPVHTVTVEPFQFMETEVTEAQFEAVMGFLPTCQTPNTGAPGAPVGCVSWFNAREFCGSIGARLPTEAEWEYAARAGSTYRYVVGNDPHSMDDFAWYLDNSQGRKHLVKEAGMRPNAFGLYDILGNMREWTQDCWHDNYEGAPTTAFPAWQHGCTRPTRIERGGDFLDPPEYSMRVSYREDHDPATSFPYFFIGVRCAR